MTAAPQKPRQSGIQLGLRENWRQFSCVHNANVMALVALRQLPVDAAERGYVVTT